MNGPPMQDTPTALVKPATDGYSCSESFAHDVKLRPAVVSLYEAFSESKGRGMLARGARVGKFILVKPLGNGGMGTVYLAEDEMLGRRVALKVLRRSVADEQQFEERFRQEARLVAALDHPNVVRIHALERIGHDLVIDMAFIEGGPLADRLKSPKFTVCDAMTMGHDVLNALACCHGAGIIHRDVKPSNVLVDAAGRYLLSDFGIAKALAAAQSVSLMQAASTHFFLGTPFYAPPEAWESDEASPAWDLYSVGIMLFEAIAADLPFTGRTVLSVMKEVTQRPAPRLSERVPAVSPELDALVVRMLAPNPGDRLQNAGEALSLLCTTPEWRSASEWNPDAPTVATLPRRPVRNRRSIQLAFAAYFKDKMRRKRLVAKAAFVMIIALAAASAFVLGSMNRGGGTSVAQPAATRPGFSVYDVFEPEGQVHPAGYAETTSPGGSVQAVMADARRLWVLEEEKQPDGSAVLSGFWAEYGDPAAHSFRYGNLSGRRVFMPPGYQSLVTLAFVSNQDGSQTSRTMYLNPASAEVTKPAALERILGAEAIPSLVNNELVPRDLAMVAEFDALVRSLGGTVLLVPAWRGNAIRVDGVLDDEAWQATPEDAPASVATAPSNEGQKAGLRAVHDGRALYIAVHAPAENDLCRLRLRLINEYPVPLSLARRYEAAVTVKGIEQAHVDSSRGATAWESDWAGAATIAQRAFAAEIRIPASEQGMLTHGLRWQLNAACEDAAGSARLSWGNEDFARAELGMLLVFHLQ